jgi:hypothetical protein
VLTALVASLRPSYASTTSPTSIFVAISLQQCPSLSSSPPSSPISPFSARASLNSDPATHATAKIEPPRNPVKAQAGSRMFTKSPTIQAESSETLLSNWIQYICSSMTSKINVMRARTEILCRWVEGRRRGTLHRRLMKRTGRDLRLGM